MSGSRYSGVDHLLSLFASEHLPPHLAKVSREFQDIAETMAEDLGSGPELTAGLRKLLVAKDCFVRQAVIDNRARPVS
jgi:hypothetical protein